MDLGIDALQHALTSTSKEERKAIVHILGKLAWPAALDAIRGTKLYVLMNELRLRADDASMRQALTRFEAALSKHCDRQAMSDENAMHALAPFLQMLPAAAATKSAAARPPNSRRKGRTPISHASDESDQDDTPEDIDDDDDEEDEDTESEVAREHESTVSKLEPTPSANDDEDELAL
jgi:histone deacetylase 2a, putative